MALGKSLHLCASVSLSLRQRKQSCLTYRIMVVRINELINVKCLGKYLSYYRCNVLALMSIINGTPGNNTFHIILLLCSDML